jgi:hypothetical protein
MYNIIIGMLHNVNTGRFHPIIFYEASMPGPPEENKIIRHKSKGHHAAGFDTRELALAEVEKVKGKFHEAYPYARVRTALLKDFPWNDELEDIPALVVFFTEVDGELTPAF